MYQFDLGIQACSPGDSSTDASTLVVNPGECCPGGNVSQCFSIAAGAWLKPEDAACDETCALTAGFISSTQTIATLQLIAVGFSAVATAAWILGVLLFRASKVPDDRARALAKASFVLWVCFCVVNSVCQLIEVGIMYAANPLGAANFIKGAGCFNDAGESGYQDLIGNLQSSRVMVWGEIVVGVVAALVGAYAINETYTSGSWHGAALEAVLLLLEDAIAVGTLVSLVTPSNAIVLASCGAMCVTPPPGYSPGAVRMCISELPYNTSTASYIAPHVNSCGRTAPHVSANFRVDGMGAPSLDNATFGLLRKGIGAVVGLEVEAVSIDFSQDITMRRAGEEAVLVWSYIDTESAAAAKTAGWRLAEAAYGDALLVSLQAAPHQMSALLAVVRERAIAHTRDPT
jgi:hypothetical protein